MKDANLIADLVRAGLDAELVGRVVNEITATMSGTNVRDSIKEYEAGRKRNQRKQGGKQTMSVENKTKPVPDIVPDKDTSSSLTSLFPTLADPLATKQGSKEEVVARRTRGARLPADWALPPIERAMAIELGMTPGDIGEFEVEFRDYWCALPGARGCKLDWAATARNRLREVSRRRRRKNGNGPGTFKDVFAGLRLELGGSGGNIPEDPPMRDITPGRARSG